MRLFQQGYALILLMLVIMALGTTLLFRNLSVDARTSPDSQVRQASDLKEARAVLLLYAFNGGVSNDPTSGRPGTLPCPDMNEPTESGFGEMNVGSCTGEGDVSLGRIPWDTLDMSVPSEPVWLAIDDKFLNHRDTEPVNPDFQQAPADPLWGRLTLDNRDRLAAVLIAPGSPIRLPSHDQVTGRESSDAFDYLERVNALTDTESRYEFTNCGGEPGIGDGDNQCNDRAVGVRASDLMRLARKRVLLEVERLLREAHRPTAAPQIPYAAAFGSSPLQSCEPGLTHGLLALVPFEASEDEEAPPGCRDDDLLFSQEPIDSNGSSYPEFCELVPVWLRPANPHFEEDFGCDQPGDGDDEHGPAGNDWLRFVSYELQPDADCSDPSQACVVDLGFIDQEPEDDELVVRRVVLEPMEE